MNWSVCTRLTMLWLVVGAAPSALAESIGVQFTGGGGVALTAGQTAGLIPQNNYNVVIGTSGSALPLKNSSGAMTNAKLSFATNESGYVTNLASDPVTSDEILHDGILNGTLGTNPSITIAGIPYASYDLIVYTLNSEVRSQRVFASANGVSYRRTVRSPHGSAPGYQDANAGTSFTYTEGADDTDTPTPNSNYVRFRNLTGAVAISADARIATFPTNTNNNAFINGFQIVENPSIGVQFTGGGGAALTANQPAGLVPRDNYNVFGGTSGSGLPLNDTKGAPTAASLSFTTNEFGYVTNPSADPTTTDEILNDGLLNGTLGTNPTITITGIPYASYDLIVYTLNNEVRSQRVTVATGTGSTSFTVRSPDGSAPGYQDGNAQTPYTYIRGATNSQTPEPGSDYVRFGNLTGNITISADARISTFPANTNNNAFINGLQIVCSNSNPAQDSDGDGTSDACDSCPDYPGSDCPQGVSVHWNQLSDDPLYRWTYCASPECSNPANAPYQTDTWSTLGADGATCEMSSPSLYGVSVGIRDIAPAGGFACCTVAVEGIDCSGDLYPACVVQGAGTHWFRWGSRAQEAPVYSDGLGGPGDDDLPNQCDNCPQVDNPTQANADGDRCGDACDSFPNDSNQPISCPEPGAAIGLVAGAMLLECLRRLR